MLQKEAAEESMTEKNCAGAVRVEWGTELGGENAITT